MEQENKDANWQEHQIDDILTEANEKMNHQFDAERLAEEYEEEEKKESKLSEFLHSFCIPVLVGILTALILTQVIFFHAEVPSGSMETTIMTGDRLIGSRIYLWYSEPQHGDIMIFWSNEYNEYLVKRVIGCPGDVVEIRSDGVYVNEQLLNDDFTKGITTSPNPAITSWVVPEDSYFLMGDNRESSADSRFWVNPFIKKENMYAKVLLRYSLGKNGWYVDRLEDVDFFL